MTSTSGNPTPLTPESKLADKRWRYINSWWIFPPVLSLGFLCWLGFLVAAIRTGKKNYWIFCALYATVLIVFLTLVTIASGDKNSLASNLAILPFLIAWTVPTIHAAILNRDYLRTLAAKGAWYQTPPSRAAQLNVASQTTPPFLGISQGDYYAQTAPTSQTIQQAPAQAPALSPPPGANTYAAQTLQPPSPAVTPVTTQPQQRPVLSPVHANTATAEAIGQLPGVGPALAQRIVAVRDARDGYRDIDDLAAAANLQPHELVRLRSHLTFDQDNPVQPQQDNATQHGTTGRILDI